MPGLRLLLRAAVAAAVLILVAIVIFGPSEDPRREALSEANPCLERSSAEIKRESQRERAGAESEEEAEAEQAEREKEPAAEEALNESCELNEPADVLLTRQLFGSQTDAPTDLYPKARAAANDLAAETRRDAPGVAAAQWRLDGPTSVGGRVLDITADPAQKDTIFIATATGGVWKSTDAGTTFKPAWPHDATQAIGALVQTPSGVLIAGTGETGPGGGSITYGGDGVYRSKDRGETWQRIGLEGTSRIGRILVDPTNEKRILVAATGNLYKPTKERGVYLTEDGGDSWKKVLTTDNDTTGGTDLATNVDGSAMFATTWDAQREPDRRRYEGPGTALYKSVDKGRTWTKVVTGPFGGTPSSGRMGVVTGTGADGKNIVWALTTSASGAFGGLYKSMDGGLTWTPRADVELVATSGSFVYGWWFGRMWVDPKDTNRLFVPGVSLNESKDGGTSFTSNGGMHADQHAMLWDPKTPNRVYLGNDGGLYRSDANGASNTWKFAKYQPFSQPYTIDVSEQDPSRLVAGLQDNGTNRSWGQKDGSWKDYTGGDGQRALIKPNDKNTVYGCLQYGECIVSHNGGDSGDSFTEKVVSSRKNWTTPIEFDPEDPKTVYTGGEILNQSDDDAETFRPISPELSNGPGRETNPLFRNYGTLTTIAPAGKSKKVIYAGTDDGNLWYTADQTNPAAWTKATDPDLPKAWITRLEVNVRNPRQAFVTYSGFRSGEDAAYLLRTNDGGKSWDNITGGLPKAPLNDVNIVGDALFVASDLGVYLSRDQGKSWYKVGGNLPAAPIFELRYHAPTNRLYAGTFGRSIWSIALDDLGKVPAVGRPAASIAGVSPFSSPLPSFVPKGSKLIRLGLPLARCLRTNRLRLRLRIPGGVRIKAVSVRVNGKRVVRRTKRRGITRAATLRLSSKRKVNTVVVTVRTTDGRLLTEWRQYRHCKKTSSGTTSRPKPKR